MKKTSLVLSLLAASVSGAWAQTSVTLYGVVDAGVVYTSGIRGSNVKQLVSGIMDGSRLGVRGTEDLGGGYRAMFTLENRLEADTGGTSNRPPSASQLPDRMVKASLLGLPGALQPVVTGVAAQVGASIGVNLGNTFWDRQAYVGLVTPVGAVLAGRQYTPAYAVQAEFDTTQTQSSLAAGQVASLPASFDIRQSNSIQYYAQTGAITVSAMVAAGEGSTSTGHFMGASAMYRTAAFSIGAGYNTRENENGKKSLTSAILGASAAVGPGKITGFYAVIKDDNPSGLSGIGASLQANPATAPFAGMVLNAYLKAFRQDAKVYNLGYRITMGANTFYTAYSKFDDTTSFNADTDSYGAVYSYAFSKRTDLNVVLTHFNNKGLGQSAPGQGGFLGGVTTSAGTDSNNFAVGLRHRF